MLWMVPSLSIGLPYPFASDWGEAEAVGDLLAGGNHVMGELARSKKLVHSLIIVTAYTYCNLVMNHHQKTAALVARSFFQAIDRNKQNCAAAAPSRS
jgi:hypothetical protein